MVKGVVHDAGVAEREKAARGDEEEEARTLKPRADEGWRRSGRREVERGRLARERRERRGRRRLGIIVDEKQAFQIRRSRFGKLKLVWNLIL